MKKWWVVVGMMMVSEIILSQSVYWIYDFENWSIQEPLIIDTVLDQNNIWQIGSPQKTVFTSAYSSPNVIVTDSLNSYPINDTSSFTIQHLAVLGWELANYVAVTGYYNSDSDSLSDYGIIDVSKDQGSTWYRIDTIQSTTGCGLADPQVAILTGNSNGWKYFGFCLHDIALQWGINQFDTILYRFTFISDSIQTNRDGLMFDDLIFIDFSSNIPQLQTNDILHLSPNPASEQFYISFDQPITNGNVCIISCEGKVMSCKEVNTNSAALDVSSLPAGMYYVQFRNENMVAVRKVVVGH